MENGNIDNNAILTALGKQLISGSLNDAAVQRATEGTSTFAILPWVNVVKIGGQSMPPYKLWEPNPAMGRIPPQRTDTGCFLIAEVFGARKMIYVKDEDGLHTADPKKDSSCEFIPRISVQELLARDLEDLIVERAVLEFMVRARHVREIQFVNGLNQGQLTAALNGEQAGPII